MLQKQPEVEEEESEYEEEDDYAAKPLFKPVFVSKWVSFLAACLGSCSFLALCGALLFFWAFSGSTSFTKVLDLRSSCAVGDLYLLNGFVIVRSSCHRKQRETLEEKKKLEEEVGPEGRSSHLCVLVVAVELSVQVHWTMWLFCNSCHLFLFPFLPLWFSVFSAVLDAPLFCLQEVRVQEEVAKRATERRHETRQLVVKAVGTDAS